MAGSILRFGELLSLVLLIRIGRKRKFFFKVEKLENPIFGDLLHTLVIAQVTNPREAPVRVTSRDAQFT